MSDRRTASASQAMEHYYNGSLGATATQITAAPSNLYGFEIQNNNASSEVFVQIFNKESADVTLGTTVPDLVFRIPAGANYGKDAQGFPIKYCPVGLTVACTSTRTGSGSPASNCSLNVWYWDKGN